MTDIAIKLEGVDDVIKHFKAVPKQVQRASRRAIGKVIKRIVTQSRRAIASAHDLPVNALKPKAGRKNNSRYRGRVIGRRSLSGKSGSVWFGRNPIKSGYVGRLRNVRTKGGARARTHFFKSGFIAQMKSGHKGIFKRVGAVRPGSRGGASQLRQKIKETTVPISSADAVIKRTSQTSNALFKKIFEQELNFEVNVRGRNR